jgi:FKBP-type peptidyl-prolyl cis-trans isomerase FkpA
MKRAVAVALVLLPLVSACQKEAAKPAASPQAGALSTEEEKTAYAAGLMLGRNLAPLNLTPAELEATKKGLADSATGKTPQVDLQTYGPKIQAMIQSRAAARASGEKEKGKAFLESAAKEADAQKTPTGLVIKTLQPGKGDSPKASDTVKVHYRGTLIDGTEFDSSIKRGQPAEFQLSGVVPCWTEGVQKMKVGEKARLVCPSEIAYGDNGSPPTIPPGATLIFEVELLDIVKKK